jgi:Rieske Fe-S protein
MPGPLTTRRAVVTTGAAGLAGAALAGCGSDDGGGGGGTGEPGESQEPLARVSDIPEGGGLILADPQVVVTQPAAGEIRAFSSVCTHEGCQVESVSDGTINCACHGSRFSVEDGSVVRGPAERPLPERSVAVDGGEVRLD